MVLHLCENILKAFRSDDRRDDLYRSLYALPTYCYFNRIKVEEFDSLLNLEQEIMNAKGKDKRYIEEKVLEILSRVSFEGKKQGPDTMILRVRFLKTVDERQRQLIAAKLKGFALQIFSMKKVRDAYNSKRKGFALTMLGNIAVAYDCPEASEKCLLALRSKKKDLISAAFEFLETHYVEHDYQLPPDIIEELDKITEQTKDRSIAVGALDIQIQTGEINELAALSRIDDWKERNYSGREMSNDFVNL